MKVEIYLLGTAQPIIHEGVENTYQKGDLFCIMVKGKSIKYPIQTIFRIVEDYNKKTTEQK